MREGIHPKGYREVLFTDGTSGKSFITRSTVRTDRTGEFEGKEYPLYQLTISSYSHPFYTGAQRLVDTQGRIDKFNKKYGRQS